FRRRVPRAACYLSAAVAGSGWLAANHGGGAVRTRLATAAVPIPGRRNPLDRRRLDDGSRARGDWRHRGSSSDCGSSFRGPCLALFAGSLLTRTLALYANTSVP